MQTIFQVRIGGYGPNWFDDRAPRAQIISKVTVTATIVTGSDKESGSSDARGVMFHRIRQEPVCEGRVF